MGVNYGLLFSAWGVAGIVGPVIAGRVFDATGEYQQAFFIAAGLRRGAGRTDARTATRPRGGSVAAAGRSCGTLSRTHSNG